jgi:hypothetical protein
VCCLKLALITNCNRTTSGRGSLTRISLSDSRWNENTINTHKYNTIYWCSSRTYYNLGSRINYIEDVWSQNYALEDKSEFAEAISLNGQNILFVLKENVIHRRSNLRIPVQSPTLIGLDFPLTILVSITGKRKQFLTCTQKTARAKFERLHSVRLIQDDQKITTRHAKALNKTNTHKPTIIRLSTIKHAN